MSPEFIPGSIVLGFALLMAAASIVLGRLELRRAADGVADVAVPDFFELSDAQVDERIAELEELLRAEADQRNCGRHERDAREAEHFDTLPDLFEGGDR